MRVLHKMLLLIIKVLYEQVHSPSPSITKNDPKCQRNPAYGVGGTIVMDTNPAYASCK